MVPITHIRISQSGLFFHHFESELCSKPFVLLVCCDNMENETPRNVVTYFKTYARFMDARIIGTLVRKSGQLMRAMELLSDGSPNPRIQKIYAAFEQAGRELAVGGRSNTATQRLANQSVLEIPFFLGLLLRIKPLKKLMLTRARAQYKTALESKAKGQRIPFEIAAETDPFYSEANQKRLRKSLADLEQSKFIVKTMDELEAMERE